MSIAVGVIVAGAMLLALADVAPDLAAGFGALVLVGSLYKSGIPAARAITTAIT